MAPRIRARDVGNNLCLVCIECPDCKGSKIFEMTHDKYREYIAGQKAVQNIFPSLSVEDRERFISGCCPSCWKSTFSEVEN